MLSSLLDVFRSERVVAVVRRQAVVSPAFVPAVVERAADRGVPAIPGAFTPTEVEAAWRSGAAHAGAFLAAGAVAAGADASRVESILSAVGATAMSVGSTELIKERRRRLCRRRERA